MQEEMVLQALHAWFRLEIENKIEIKDHSIKVLLADGTKATIEIKKAA